MNALGVDIGGSAAKAVLITDGQVVWSSTSGRYRLPDATEVARALSALLVEAPDVATNSPLCLGLCAPGMYDEQQGFIVRSVNMPGLVGVSLAKLITDALPESLAARAELRCVTSDAHAAGHDLLRALKITGRLLAISLGTGVGAIVLDDGVPVRVSGMSSGHLGQLDVTVDGLDPIPIGPDGGRGSLEGYIGGPAIASRHGDPAAWLAGLRGHETEIRALVRAIRIAHAIYRPQTIALLGGVGVRLRPIVSVIDAAVRDGLTSLARPDWRLVVGDSELHAARGVATLAVGGNVSTS